MGFEKCGIDYEVFSARGQYFDEILMTKKQSKQAVHTSRASAR